MVIQLVRERERERQFRKPTAADVVLNVMQNTPDDIKRVQEMTPI